MLTQHLHLHEHGGVACEDGEACGHACAAGHDAVVLASHSHHSTAAVSIQVVWVRMQAVRVRARVYSSVASIARLGCVVSVAILLMCNVQCSTLCHSKPLVHAG